MRKIIPGFKKDDARSFLAAFLVALLVFSGVTVARAATGTAALTVTVAQTLTFSVDTASAEMFGTLTPGTYKWATSTLSVTTNDAAGYNVTLSGDNKSSSQNNCLSGANSITDQTEWINGASTSTAGDAVTRASLTNSGNVFAFRVMTASSSNGADFANATSWWGANDVDGTALFAGVASSTVQRKIGNAGNGSYSSTAHLNTVRYYMNVATAQAQGSYTCPLTYTATGN